MVKVTFIKTDKEIVITENETGKSLMEIAVNHGIEGIDAECGGACACATCHVHIAQEWMPKVGPANEYETDLLSLEDETSENSRLACQVTLSDELDGLIVTVAGS